MLWQVTNSMEFSVLLFYLNDEGCVVNGSIAMATYSFEYGCCGFYFAMYCVVSFLSFLCSFSSLGALCT